MDVLTFGHELGLKSKISANRVWPLGPQPAERGVFGHNEGVACGARGTVTNPAQPMAPAVPRAPWASLPAIPVAGSGLTLFFSGIPAPKTD